MLKVPHRIFLQKKMAQKQLVELVAVVKEALCQGCGVCTSICPNGAAFLQGFTEDQIMAMIEHAV